MLLGAVSMEFETSAARGKKIGELWDNGRVNEVTGPDAPEMSTVQSWHVPRLIVAWSVALVLGVLISVLVPGDDRFGWLVLAIGVATLVTFALQLGTAERVGFITRVAFSVAGSVVIIALIDIIGWLIGQM